MPNKEKASILEFVLKQRRRVLSYREWKHRLIGFGFGIAETDQGHVLTALPGGHRLCRLPERYCA